MQPCPQWDSPQGQGAVLEEGQGAVLEEGQGAVLEVFVDPASETVHAAAARARALLAQHPGKDVVVSLGPGDHHIGFGGPLRLGAADSEQAVWAKHWLLEMLIVKSRLERYFRDIRRLVSIDT